MKLAENGEFYTRDLWRHVVAANCTFGFDRSQFISLAHKLLARLEREGRLVSRLDTSPAEHLQRRYFRKP